MKRISLVAAWGFLLLASTALGQGVLVVINPPQPVPLPRPIPRPTPPTMSYKIKELDYHARITDQIAQMSVTQSFVNTGSQQMEVSFVFPLPYDGAIDHMTFLVDGKEYDAKILPAKEARQIYESYVRRNQDPAMLEWVGYGMFQTSVFPVPPGAERKVTLKFSQLLRKDHQLTDFLIPLSTAKYTSAPVEKLSIHVAIETAEELKSVYSPTHPINVERSDNKHAVVKLEATNTVPTSDFRLLFDTAAGKLGASVISYRPDSGDEGFFLLLASPEIKAASDDRPAKTVVFVVDRSGSMSGKKIEQAKEALKFVLNNLRPGDTFNIVAYDSNVESFRPELQRFDDETRKAALGFVDGLYAGGSTNIDGALSTALGMIKDDSRPNYVLFLTDGLPTAGETSEAKIAANAKSNNKVRTRMINMGVGYDVNSRLLDRLSRDNYGQSGYVRPDESIEAHVSRLYSKMSAPVMTGVTVKFDIEGSSSESGGVSRVYPKDVHDLFAGEQLVMVGRYKKAGGAKVTITGRVGASGQKFDFPANFMEKSQDQKYSFVEKLWAMRRIGEIIDELDLKGKNEELIKELVGLSTKYGILTPYTAFLADETKSVKLADVRLHYEAAGRSLERLREAEGIAGFTQRADKNVLQNAQLAPLAAAPVFGAGGFGGGAPGQGQAGVELSKLTRGANVIRDIDTDKTIVATGVQCAGKETLYKCGNIWVATNAQHLDPEKDADKIKRIKRFSDEYFTLVSANTQDENAVLAAQQEGEELLCVFRGQAYRID